jgi:hypothetical protein
MRTPREDPFEEAMSDEAFADFVSKARSTFIAQPSIQVASRHLAAIVEVASSLDYAPDQGHARPKASSRRRRFAFKLAALTGAAFMALGGLAFAGVLPQKMQDAISDAAAKAGFTLPVSDEREAANAAHAGDSNDKNVSSDVTDVAKDRSLTGREKGETVSDVADQNRQNEAHPTSTASSPSDEPSPKDHPTGKP